MFYSCTLVSIKLQIIANLKREPNNPGAGVAVQGHVSLHVYGFLRLLILPSSQLKHIISTCLEVVVWWATKERTTEAQSKRANSNQLPQDQYVQYCIHRGELSRTTISRLAYL